MPRLDIVIFGATGFTGKRLAATMLTLLKEHPTLTWGVAGRSKEKLEDLVAELAANSGEDLSKVKIIVADVGEPKSLKSMCERAKVLVNCCGPYRLLGPPVVRAAIQGSAHYVDVCGEPQFMEQMQLDYDAQARHAGVYVISACGFDCVPCDLGVVYLQQHFPGTLNTVKAYLSLEVPRRLWPRMLERGAVHYATWESLVYGLRHRAELSALRKKLFPVPLPKFTPRLGLEQLVHRAADGSCCVPLLTADASVVRRSQRRLWEQCGVRPVHFRAFVLLGLARTALLLLMALLVNLLTVCDAGARLLLRYHRLFSLKLVSREGPAEEVASNTRFTLELRAQGWGPHDNLDEPPTKHMKALVRGTNPGYGATALCALLAAAAVLRDPRMPASGGVMTPGFAFRNTNLVENLNKHNVTFEILNTNSEHNKGGVLSPGTAFHNTQLVKNLQENGLNFEIISKDKNE